jgi:hypothetical protein
MAASADEPSWFESHRRSTQGAGNGTSWNYAAFLAARSRRSPAIGSPPCHSTRRKIVFSMKRCGSSFAVSSFQPSGVDTVARGVRRA